MHANQPFIVCDNLVKIYKVADLEVVALQGLDLQIGRGELVGIVGKSGSGKSTLLQILGGLDRPSAGRVTVGSHDLLALDHSGLVDYTRHTTGFVWQQTGRNLLPYLSALKNIELPMLVAGTPRKLRQARARELIELVGLGHRATHRLTALSGGEQQRLALAIALANDPPLILADEPTGELDARTAAYIFDLFGRLASDYGKTVVIVSHDPGIKQHVGRVIGIRDGRTSTETVRQQARVGEAEETSHAEYMVLDAAGRLQLPADVVDELGFRGRVTIERVAEGVIIRTPRDDGGSSGRAAS
ncbi:MAG: ABC transporter ATP-binding protein [Chloroflexota bacterium]|nr:ABC transporter ATP-binding protein [Chloroflexota bacterium]PLS82655.1 MAG: ABC transporter [Chloroflexota bacterium]